MEHDINIAAQRWAESMTPRADIKRPCPAWHLWALREAFIAGVRFRQERERAKREREKGQGDGL